MSVVDVIIVTAAATAVAISLGVAVYATAVRVMRYARELLAALKASAEATKTAAQVVTVVSQELAYMRQLTQGQVVQQEEVMPQPPLGRAGRMPPPFPTRDFAVYADAKTADTDQSLLEQTEQEVLEAQAREEARAAGIEPDDDGVPQHAVVEEA